MDVIFETERLIVRRFTTDDGDNFFLLHGDEEIMRYIRPVKTREESDVFLQEVVKSSIDNPLCGRWAVHETLSGNFVGSFAFIPVEKSDKMQLGYSLLKSGWGKGYATELTIAGLNYVFAKTDLTEIFGITETGNLASQKVLLKAGFTFFKTFMEAHKELFQYRFLKEDFKPEN